MYIFKVSAFNKVQIKCKLSEYTHARRKVPTTYTPTYWIWLNVDRDDPRGLSHRSACPRPFTPDWDYCKKHGLNNLAEMNIIRVYQYSLLLM